MMGMNAHRCAPSGSGSVAAAYVEDTISFTCDPNPETAYANMPDMKLHVC